MAYKYLIVSAACGIVTLLAGYLVRKWNTRVDIQAKKDTAQIDLKAQEEALALKTKAAALATQNEPLVFMKEMIDRREADLADERKQCREERAESLKTLGAMQVALEALVKDLAAHREEERSRSSGVHERLDQFGDRLLVIETRLGVRASA